MIMGQRRRETPKMNGAWTMDGAMMVMHWMRCQQHLEDLESGASEVAGGGSRDALSLTSCTTATILQKAGTD